MKTSVFVLTVFVIIILAIATCGVGSTPQAGVAQPAATPTSTIQSTATQTATATSTRTPKPTATFVPLVTPSPTPDVPRIDVKEARAKADAGQAVFVDVRSAQVYEAQHIVDAISLPATEVADRYSELPADRLLIFYCD